MTAPAPTDHDLVPVLRAVQYGDDADSLLDNDSLARVLGLSLIDVAQRLEAAKARRFIWGVRSGQRPGPWYTELEVTVQGRRFLASQAAASG
jgi:hypothetical protein